jgi:hypothetical protein
MNFIRAANFHQITMNLRLKSGKRALTCSNKVTRFMNGHFRVSMFIQYSTWQRKVRNIDHVFAALQSRKERCSSDCGLSAGFKKFRIFKKHKNNQLKTQLTHITIIKQYIIKRKNSFNMCLTFVNFRLPYIKGYSRNRKRRKCRRDEAAP